MLNVDQLLPLVMRPWQLSTNAQLSITMRQCVEIKKPLSQLQSIRQSANLEYDFVNSFVFWSPRSFVSLYISSDIHDSKASMLSQCVMRGIVFWFGSWYNIAMCNIFGGQMPRCRYMHHACRQPNDFLSHCPPTPQGACASASASFTNCMLHISTSTTKQIPSDFCIYPRDI